MKRSIVRTVFVVATLVISLAAVAQAHDDGACSNAGVDGKWGYTPRAILSSLRTNTY